MICDKNKHIFNYSQNSVNISDNLMSINFKLQLLDCTRQNLTVNHLKLPQIKVHKIIKILEIRTEYLSAIIKRNNRIGDICILTVFTQI